MNAPKPEPDLKRVSDALYEKYGRPLEAEHWGEFVAIMADGRWVLGQTVAEVLDTAVAAFGPGTFVFKVGEKAVGKIR